MIKNAGVVVALVLAGCQRGQPPEGFQGVVELEERQLAFEVPGRVAEVPVRAGDSVTPGRLIARLDDGLARAALAAREAESHVAEQQWKLVRAGARTEDVRALQQRLNAARAVESLAERNAGRVSNLAAAQAVTPAASDEATAQLERARSERRALDENLRALVRGPRAQELEAALQRSAAAQAALTLERERLARHQLHAERAAEVLEVHLEPGEMAAAGLPVVTVADVARPYAEVFVPQGRLQGLQPGTPALARVDGVAEEIPGSIELVYRRTEFTPHYLFSESERGNLVVRIRVRLHDPGRRLHAGVPVFVRFQPAGQRHEPPEHRHEAGHPRSSRPTRLSRRFGSLVAVRDVSLTVHAGEIFGVLGPQRRGQVHHHPDVVRDPRSHQRQRDRGRLPPAGRGREDQDAHRLHDPAVQPVRGPDRQREPALLRRHLRGVGRRAPGARGRRPARAGLEARRDQLAGTLSGGWKQRVALACSTIHQPPLLFLDEPTAGVDPVSRRDFWEQIHLLSSAGTTVLMTTHYMDEAERCHRLAFIFRGALLDVGTPAEIVERRHLRAAEMEADRPLEAARLLRALPAVEEVSHFGTSLRVATRDGADPPAVIAPALDAPAWRSGTCARRG